MALSPGKCQTATGLHRSHSWMSGSHRGTAPIHWSRAQSQFESAREASKLLANIKGSPMNQWYTRLMLINAALGLK